ncbi:MAG: DUF1684 domain-containing protein [Gemmatimonadetes bacterium]|nr:DUF1684 domain-containing protein [Gemmatimonadota bacterium]
MSRVPAPVARRLMAALAAAVVATIAACGERTPPLPRLDAAAYANARTAWQARRLKGIAGPDGWITLAGLFWLDGERYTLGSDPASDLVLPAAVARRFGTLTIANRVVRFTAAPGAAVMHDSTRVDTITMLSDTNGRKPTILTSGPVRMELLDRTGRLALRVGDSTHALRRAFTSIEVYPVDSTVRVMAKLVPHATPRVFRTVNVVGLPEDYEGMGILHFTLRGRPFTLDAARQPNDTMLYLIFRDSSSDAESYPAGRFLRAPLPGPDGWTVVDFNFAYNPPCAFTSFSTCPLPPRQNVLAVRIAAGEKTYTGPHDTTEHPAPPLPAARR